MIQEAEEWFGSKSEAEQIVFGDPGSYLDDCDDKAGWEKASLITLLSSDQKQGSGCLEYTGDESSEFNKAFSTPYKPEMGKNDAAIEFWYYVSDVSKYESSNQVEVGSAGKNDEDEFNWKLTDLSNGWNYISLKFSEASTMGNPDFNAINWFRIYHKKTGAITTRLDGIKIVDKNATSIVNHALEKSLNVYPNPLKGNLLNVDLTGFENSKEINVSITNLLGQHVYQESFRNNKRIVIDTSGVLNTSAYLLTVHSDNSRLTTKIIVE